MGLSPAGIYIITMTIISFTSTFVGRLLPYAWFDPQRVPYKSFRFERDGKLYMRLKIHKWYKKLPDASKIFRKRFPEKSLRTVTKEKLDILIKETCIAEFVHSILCVIGFLCGILNRGPGVKLLTWVYILIGNLHFILIQRYNRPRLLHLLNRLEKEETSVNVEESIS